MEVQTSQSPFLQESVIHSRLQHSVWKLSYRWKARGWTHYLNIRDSCYSYKELCSSGWCFWPCSHLSNSSSQSSLLLFINVPFRMSQPVFPPAYQLLTADQCICWRCCTALVCGWMWQLSVEVGGALLRPDGRCDQACFSASPLAPIGVTMLHLACESSQGRDSNHSRGGGLLLWVWVKGGGDRLRLPLLL